MADPTPIPIPDIPKDDLSARLGALLNKGTLVWGILTPVLAFSSFLFGHQQAP
jgi:hypothetical protein